MGSGLCAVAPRCLSTESAGRTMTVLRHALCGDDFHQTPVPIIFSENVQSFSGFCGRCNTGVLLLLLLLLCSTCFLFAPKSLSAGLHPQATSWFFTVTEHVPLSFTPTLLTPDSCVQAPSPSHRRARQPPVPPRITTCRLYPQAMTFWLRVVSVPCTNVNMYQIFVNLRTPFLCDQKWT